jgi:cysteine-rich repeat protein
MAIVRTLIGTLVVALLVGLRSVPAGAVCGDLVVDVGEACDDGNLIDGDGCSSTCQREFLNPVPAAGDFFGRAIVQVGSNLLVGTPNHDEPGAIDTGIAYVLKGDTGTVLRMLQNPTPNAGDMFGLVVASLGTDYVVGAPFDDTAGPNAGAVYIFNGTTGVLKKTLLNPSPATNNNFGRAIAAFGTTSLIVGAPLDPSGIGGGGVAYLLNATTGSVSQVFLNPSPAADDEFGYAVAAVGGNILVGAPRHDRPAIGFDPGAHDAGEAYLFEPALGTLVHTIADPNPADGDLFGRAVAAIDTNALVGPPVTDGTAPSGGAAYIFNGTTGALLVTLGSPTPSINNEFGYAVVAVGPSKVLVGARREDPDMGGGPVANAGAAHLFDAATGTLLQSFQKVAPAADDEFGTAVAAIGSRLFVGAPRDDSAHTDAGAVYSFLDTSCGNGTLDPGETCDDGNLVDGDGCDSNCTPTGCGNGIVTGAEACDDGNTTAGDGCSPTCDLEGLCGDGVQAPFEACDDGNLVDGDGCDSNCTPTGCGNGIVTAPETCDQGALNGITLCCSVTCQSIDTDADGVCDQDDVCPNVPDPLQSNQDGDIFGDACDACPADLDNDSDGDGFCVGATFNPPAIGGNDPCSRTDAGGIWTKPKVKLGRILAPFGDEKLTAKGFFLNGSDLPVLAPDLHGVRVRITDKVGLILADWEIPGGLYDKAIKVGWKVRSGTPPTKWTFQDKRRPGGYNGLQKVVIKDFSRREPGQIGFLLKAKDGTYPFQNPAAQAPIQVTVELNANALPPGGTPGRNQCGETAFGVPPAEPACEVRGINLVCK